MPQTELQHHAVLGVAGIRILAAARLDPYRQIEVLLSRHAEVPAQRVIVTPLGQAEAQLRRSDKPPVAERQPVAGARLQAACPADSRRRRPARPWCRAPAARSCRPKTTPRPIAAMTIDSPRSDAGVGSYISEALAPHSSSPDASCVSRPRTATSSDRPLAGLAKPETPRPARCRCRSRRRRRHGAGRLPPTAAARRRLPARRGVSLPAPGAVARRWRRWPPGRRWRRCWSASGARRSPAPA